MNSLETGRSTPRYSVAPNATVLVLVVEARTRQYSGRMPPRHRTAISAHIGAPCSCTLGTKTSPWTTTTTIRTATTWETREMLWGYCSKIRQKVALCRHSLQRVVQVVKARRRIRPWRARAQGKSVLASMQERVVRGNGERAGARRSRTITSLPIGCHDVIYR